jgi:hypothetical protein
VHRVGLDVLVEEPGRARVEAEPPQRVGVAAVRHRRAASRRPRGGRRSPRASGGAGRAWTSGSRSRGSTPGTWSR